MAFPVSWAEVPSGGLGQALPPGPRVYHSAAPPGHRPMTSARPHRTGATRLRASARLACTCATCLGRYSQ
eukprot:9499274-Pyramimonas_sp.AAC.1